jgi:hypothetical protein
VDDLFGLPPDEFTAARDALAKRLKAHGDTVGAAEVKSLRRPTVAAWAVNQVARDQPALVDAVVDAGRSLVAAQERLLGGGGRDDLRAATAARREAVAAATRAAVALAGDTHRDAIHATFDAAATDEEAGAAVAAGRLPKELDPPSSFALLGNPFALTGDDEAAEVESETEPEPEPEVDDAALAEAGARLEAAQAEADAAGTERDRLVAQLADADARVAAARAAVREAEDEVARIAAP